MEDDKISNEIGMMSLNDYLDYLDTSDHKAFDKIGEVISKYVNGVNSIYLDIFKDKNGDEHTYIVVEFTGGGKSVRRANMNSLIANIQEMSKLLNGGYYNEIKEYEECRHN